MANKTICRLGNPVLRKNSQNIKKDEIHSPIMTSLTQDLVETMRTNGGIGLAAPQIGINVNVVVVEIASDNNRYPYSDKIPLTILYNPEIEIIDHSVQGFWEGCLSIPDLRGYVERPKKISVIYRDHEYRKREIIAEQFLATVFQHEIDHLRGQLYVDRIKDFSKFSCLAEYEAFHINPAIKYSV